VVRLYADENFPRPVVETLRTLGHDVLTVQETRTVGTAMPDRDVLSFASSEERAVLTINRRDFIRLHAADPAHAGIIVCTLDLDFAGQARASTPRLRRTQSSAGYSYA
jgi:Domain of unknown function (DUF5615)